MQTYKLETNLVAIVLFANLKLCQSIVAVKGIKIPVL